MIVTRCGYCEENIRVVPYYYSPAIIKEELYLDPGTAAYLAAVQYSYICPKCGRTNKGQERSYLSTQDIVELATQRVVKLE